MGLLSTLNRDADKKPSDNSDNFWEHIAVRPTSFDVDNMTTTGINIKTGEEITVRLQKSNNSSRDNVDEWAKIRYKTNKGIVSLANNKAVVTGSKDEAGVICFEACQKGADGIFESRWATTMSHAAVETSVAHVLVRPIPQDQRNPITINSSLGLDVIDPSTATKVSTIDELSAQMHKILSEPFAQVVIRIQDDDDGIATALVKRPYTDELKALNNQVKKAGDLARSENKPWNQIRRASNNMRESLKAEFAIADTNAVNQSIPAFYSFDSVGKWLKTLSEENFASLSIEAVKVKQIYPGDNYKDVLSKSSSIDHMMLERDYRSADGVLGFVPSFISIREHEEGGLQYTKIRPDSTRPKVYLDHSVWPSENIRPTDEPVPGLASVKQRGNNVETAAEAKSQVASSAANDEPAPSIPESNGSDIQNKLDNARRSFSAR